MNKHTKTEGGGTPVFDVHHQQAAGAYQTAESALRGMSPHDPNFMDTWRKLEEAKNAHHGYVPKLGDITPREVAEAAGSVAVVIGCIVVWALAWV